MPDNGHKGWLDRSIKEGNIKCISEDDILDRTFIGYSGYGVVFKAKLKAKLKDTGMYIALKTLISSSINYDEKLYKRFVEELKNHKAANAHPNIIKFLGVCRDIFNDCIIYEYADGGTLRQHLNEQFDNLTWKDKYKLGLEIANGLRFLHSLNIFHLNMSSNSILIQLGVAKISDLRLTTVIKEMMSITPSEVAAAYKDPGYFKDDDYDGGMEADVFSLGVILWEISSGRHPCEGRTSMEDIISYRRKGHRDPPFSKTPKDYIELYSKCWREDPTKRPSSEEVYEQLRTWALEEIHIDSRMGKGILGATIELMGTVAITVDVPKTTELVSMIDRIIKLMDTVRYNIETLPLMKQYMTEIRQVISHNDDVIDSNSLMKALKDLEKFLVQYTKPKMITLLRFFNMDQIDRKIQTLFNNLDSSLSAANVILDFDNIRRLRQQMGYSQDQLEDAETMENGLSSIKYAITKRIQNSFITTACCHGVPVVKEKIDRLKIRPEWIKPAPDSPCDPTSNTEKVMYRGSIPASKVKIAKEGDDIDMYWRQAYISSILKTDLFVSIHSVVVDTYGNVKLGNFWSCRGIGDYTTSISEVTERIRWLCPEKVIDNNLPYSMEADVYSFGMLMWEISSHEAPFAGKHINVVMDLLKSDSSPRPALVPSAPKKYNSILQKCWRQDPTARPIMHDVVKELEQLYEDYIRNAETYEPVSDTDSEPRTLKISDVTIKSALHLHAQKRYKEAFEQFKILADRDVPDPEANFYVGRYLIDKRIVFDHDKDPNVGISYLEVATQLGYYDAIQYLAQEKMAAAAALQKKFREAGQDEDADLIRQRMKTECLPLFLEGAEHGNIRCMKDLADYGKKLGDESSYQKGLAMLKKVKETAKDPRDKTKAKEFLDKLKKENYSSSKK
ncbi:1808_t:CDS:2 [Paraglomus occultum]|uniref:1808_t:CDS:1 n=1 Tax=Paraglomus occultum TaxID=144539 RepID=A0A9N8ZTX3_9GLOM|nr:1808_t:CDS:2 [Paraglomus occultum]